jgi:hypothetical protein
MVGKQLLPSHRVNFSVKHQGAGLPKTVSPTDDFQSGFPDTSLEEAIHETKPILQCRENDRISDIHVVCVSCIEEVARCLPR